MRQAMNGSNALFVFCSVSRSFITLGKLKMHTKAKGQETTPTHGNWCNTNQSSFTFFVPGRRNRRIRKGRKIGR